jgi:hypothetical protein
MADTVYEFTIAICRKEGAVEPDAMLVDSNRVAFEQIIDFERGHRDRLSAAYRKPGVGDDLHRQ